MRKITIAFAAACAFYACAASSKAHDTWVQTNTNLVRTGDSIFIDLMLGNHGNEHRDFKIAGKIDPGPATLEVITAGGMRYDIKDRLVDTGYAPREGYYAAKFTPRGPGLYTVSHTLDKLHNTSRTIKSAKTFFLIADNLDKVSKENPSFEKPLGHALELTPVTNPVTPMGPGEPIGVRLTYRGEPLPDARVSFIPRGQKLAAGFDDQFERKTDAKGLASFTPADGNYLLIVAHHVEPGQKGDGYDETKYSATMTVFVPDICPCCGE